MPHGGGGVYKGNKAIVDKIRILLMFIIVLTIVSSGTKPPISFSSFYGTFTFLCFVQVCPVRFQPLKRALGIDKKLPKGESNVY